MPKDSGHRPALLQRDVVHGARAGAKGLVISFRREPRTVSQPLWRAAIPGAAQPSLCAVRREGQGARNPRQNQDPVPPNIRFAVRHRRYSNRHW
jgi:hypothetical protein